MSATSNFFIDIEENDGTKFEWENITDLKRLKRFRSVEDPP